MTEPLTDPVAAAPVVKSRRRRRRTSFEVVIPGTLLALIAAACLLAPILPGLPDPNLVGRDLLSRSLHGGQLSIIVGLGSVAVGLLIGGTLGIVAGYAGGAVDTVVMRVLDVFLAFPSLVLALVVATYLGPSIPNLIIAIAFFAIPSYARIARAGALSVRERDFVLSARLTGARAGHILIRHVTPRVIGSLLTYGLLICGIAIITEASLSFLGLGISPPTPSWGSMMADGKTDLSTAPQSVLVPGLLLFLTVVSLNLLADGIRHRLDSEGSSR